MVQGKKTLNNSKPKFAEDVIGYSEANGRSSRSSYLKLFYPNSVTLILSADTSIEQLRVYISSKCPKTYLSDEPYLFCLDLDACRRAAMMYSLFGACKVLYKNPERWLCCCVLKHIDTTPEDRLYTLLPEFWEDGG